METFCRESDSGFFYRLENGRAVITGAKEWPAVLVIPPLVDGHPVVGIANAAFDTDVAAQQHSLAPDPVDIELFSVKLMDMSIQCRIQNCVREVVLPDTLEFIGSCAFYQNFSLEKINFPQSLREVGPLAFCNASLPSIRVPKGCKLYHEDDGEIWEDQGAFEGCAGYENDGETQCKMEIEYF